MRHLIFGDPHIHPFTQFSTGAEHNSSRVATTLRVISEIRDFAIQQEITSVICLGDVFHSTNAVQFAFYNETYKLFRSFKEKGLNLIILKGNHDEVTKDGRITTLDPFLDVAVVVTEPEDYIYNYEGKRISDTIALVPYCRDFERGVTNLSGIPDYKIVLHHLDIVGADTGLGWVSNIGIGRDNFKRFKLSLGGHYHKRQEVLPNSYYIGCVCPQEFNEKNEFGHFVVLEDQTAKVEWYTTSAPRFIEWNPEAAMRMDGQPFNNCYVKVFAEQASWHDESLKNWGAVSWIYAPERRAKTVLPRQSGITVDSNHASTVKTYATIHAGTLPVDELIQVGQSLLEESR